MDTYYNLNYRKGLLEFTNIHGTIDLVNPSQISRTSTARIKGGYCVYVYFNGIKEAVLYLPNLGDGEDGLEKSRRINSIIENSIHEHLGIHKS